MLEKVIVFDQKNTPKFIKLQWNSKKVQNVLKKIFAYVDLID